MAASPTPDVAGTVFDESEIELARTYADALLGAALKEDGADAAIDELDELVADVWYGQPRVAAVLTSPAVSPREKERLLGAIFEGRALPIVMRFLQVLNRHGRVALLPVIAREVRAAWDRKQNRRHVQVRSAVPLDEGQLAALRERLRSLVRGEPVLHPSVDPSLIGGLVVQVDDFVYDASVRTGFLERFRRQMIDRKTHDILARQDAFRTL